MEMKNVLQGINTVQNTSNDSRYPPHKDIRECFFKRTSGKSDEEVRAEVERMIAEYKDKKLQRGEEPDTQTAFQYDFETLGIPPADWRTVPYDAEKYPPTQIGLSYMFADWGKGRVWFDPVRKVYYVRVNGNIEVDLTGKLMNDLRDEFYENLRYAASRIQNKTYRKEFKKHINRFFQKDADWKRVLEGALPYISIDSATKDTDKYVIATKNHVISMHREDGTYEIREMSSEDFIIRHLGTEYDKDAEAPNFIRLVNTSLGDPQKVKFFQMSLGLALCGINEQKFAILFYGRGANNGKSTILKAVTDTFGDYACSTREVILAQSTNENYGATADLAIVQGARVIMIRELSQNFRLDASKLKRLTGNDYVSARGIFKDPQAFVPQGVLYMDCNSLPAVSDMSVFDRGTLWLLTFNKAFNGAERDTSLAKKLESEHAGILNWALEGYRMYCEECPDCKQMEIPDCIRKDTMAFRGELDHIQEFLECVVEYTGDSKDQIKTSAMHTEYKQWAISNGYEVDTIQTFNTQLSKRLNIELDKLKIKSNSGYYYKGFRIRKRDTADRSGLTTYLETEYQAADSSETPLASLFADYTNWANTQGICSDDVLDFFALANGLSERKYRAAVKDGQLVVKGIRKVVADEDIDCESNQITM